MIRRAGATPGSRIPLLRRCECSAEHEKVRGCDRARVPDPTILIGLLGLTRPTERTISITRRSELVERAHQSSCVDQGTSEESSENRRVTGAIPVDHLQARRASSGRARANSSGPRSRNSAIRSAPRPSTNAAARRPMRARRRGRPTSRPMIDASRSSDTASMSPRSIAARARGECPRTEALVLSDAHQQTGEPDPAALPRGSAAGTDREVGAPAGAARSRRSCERPRPDASAGILHGGPVRARRADDDVDGDP